MLTLAAEQSLERRVMTRVVSHTEQKEQTGKTKRRQTIHSPLLNGGRGLEAHAVNLQNREGRTSKPSTRWRHRRRLGAAVSQADSNPCRALPIHVRTPR